MFTSADEKVIEQKEPDRNGTINGIKRIVCNRCNGSGSFKYVSMGRLTCGVCFKCNGLGYVDKKFKIMTPEYRAKRDKINLCNQQKAEEKRNVKELERLYWQIKQKGFDQRIIYIVNEPDTYVIKDDLKSAGALYDDVIGWYFLNAVKHFSTEMVLTQDIYEIRNSELIYKQTYLDKSIQTEGEFLFSVGDSFELVVTYSKYERIDNPFAYKAYIYFYEFLDESGNLFIWKTSKNEIDVVQGEKICIKARLKDHKEWKKRNKVIRQNMIKNVRIIKDYK